MTDITIDDLIHANSVDLAQNQITSVDNTSDFLKHASNLVFDTNSIQGISQNFLKTIENVESLDLSENQLKMSQNMFEPLKKLKKLNLGNNDFRTIQPEWFTGLTKLESLSFGSNNLTSFDYILLVNILPSLKRLNLEGANEFKCGFLKKMVEDLKAINRLDVIKREHSVEEENDFIYDIRCERDPNDRSDFSQSYLEGNYRL